LLPDLAATSLAWNTAQAGVDFGYSVKGADLSQDTTAALYWASGTTFATAIGGPVYDTTIEHPIGDYGPFYVPNTVLLKTSANHLPPPDAKYLLLVINPDDAVAESDGPINKDTNNVQFLPIADVTLQDATQDSPRSVSVDFSITDASVEQPLEFDIYRSDQPSLDKSSASKEIGTQILDPSTDPQDLAIGTHKVTLIQGTELPPDPSMPYIVVVADPSGSVLKASDSVTQTYFQTYLLGAVVHGFEPNITIHLHGRISIRLTPSGTPSWETTMSMALEETGHYSRVIPFNWVVRSGLKAPGQTQLAAGDLYAQILAKADQLASGHVETSLISI
jgi:hypothetical protein